MVLECANENNIYELVAISKRAFETDVCVGGEENDFPPDYDGVSWHMTMLKEGHLFQAMEHDKLLGGAILFLNDQKDSLYVGRIFIDSPYHRMGYGQKLMNCIEQQYPSVREIVLDTPCWNIRTNQFYKKMGYTEEKRENGFVFYKKIVNDN